MRIRADPDPQHWTAAQRVAAASWRYYIPWLNGRGSATSHRRGARYGKRLSIVLPAQNGTYWNKFFGKIIEKNLLNRSTKSEMVKTLQNAPSFLHN